MRDHITKKQIKELTVEKIYSIECVNDLVAIESKVRSMLSDIKQDICLGTKLFAQDPKTLVQMTVFGTEQVVYKECECCKRKMPMKMFYLDFKNFMGNARAVCTDCHKAFNGNGRRFLKAIATRTKELTANQLDVCFNRGKRYVKEKHHLSASDEMCLSNFMSDEE